MDRDIVTMDWEADVLDNLRFKIRGFELVNGDSDEPRAKVFFKVVAGKEDVGSVGVTVPMKVREGNNYRIQPIGIAINNAKDLFVEQLQEATMELARSPSLLATAIPPATT